MNIVMITDNDPAGVAITLSRAITRLTEHDCRLITRSKRYNFEFDTDLHLPDFDDDDWDEVEYILKGADVFHFHILDDENVKLGPLQVKPFTRRRLLVNHHHGHPDLRSRPEFFRGKYERLNRPVLVSTPDLMKLMPRATWLPNPVALDDPLLTPDNGRTLDKIEVIQTPTRIDLKNTAEFARAMSVVAARNGHVRGRIIENTPHKECLAIRRRAHVAFDHMQGYYGLASIEALSQGLATIAGLDDHCLGLVSDFAGGAEPPWLIARTEARLIGLLEELSADVGRLPELWSSSRDFMERHWTERIIVDRLQAFYEEALA